MRLGDRVFVKSEKLFGNIAEIDDDCIVVYLDKNIEEDMFDIALGDDGDPLIPLLTGKRVSRLLYTYKDDLRVIKL